MKWIMPNNDGTARIFDNKKDSIVEELLARWLFKDRTKKKKTKPITFEQIYKKAIKMVEKHKISSEEREMIIAYYCMEQIQKIWENEK